MIVRSHDGTVVAFSELISVLLKQPLPKYAFLFLGESLKASFTI